MSAAKVSRFALPFLLLMLAAVLGYVGLITKQERAASTLKKKSTVAEKFSEGDAVHLPGVPPHPPEILFYPERFNAAVPLAVLSPVTILNNSGNGYPGIDFNLSGGFAPPDSCGAAGPSNYVETTNQEIAIYSPKSTGATANTDSLDHFFFTVGGLSRADVTSGLSDPIVAYDELIGRFIVGDQDVDFTTHVSNFVFAVSKTNAPATLTSADWNFYAVSTTEVGYDADYPGNFGYNADAWVFTLNMFPVAVGSNHVLVTSVNATDLANGVSQGSLHAFQTDLSDFAVRPTTMHGSVAGDPMWLVTEHGNGMSIDVIKMTNVLSATPSFTTTNLAVNSYSQVAAPLNPNASAITTNIDSRILKSSEANNTLVATQSVGVSSTQDDVRWYVVNVSSGTPTLSDEGNISAGNNTYLVYPAIDITSNGIIGLTYMRSGTDTATDYMSMYVTGRVSTDPAGTMQTPVLVPSGTGQANYGDFTGTGRAGDLSGINVDPVDSSFWAASEFANTEATANWGTAIANFTVSAPTPTPTPKPTPHPGTANGSGTIFTHNNQASFNFSVSNLNGPPTGTLIYTDTKGGIKLTSTAITAISLVNNQATFSGKGTLPGSKPSKPIPVSFTVIAVDNGKGSKDTFTIQISLPYYATGNLTSGNITVN